MRVVTSSRGLFFATVFILSARAAPPARADEESTDEPTVSPAEVPGAVSVGAAEEQPLPPPATPATPAAGPPPAAPPPDLERPGLHPSVEDKWPIELVRRPLTLPGGMASFGVEFSGFRPNNHVNVNPTTGGIYTYNSYVAVGPSLVLGLTDDFQLGFSMPRLLCFASATPPACNGIDLYDGTGGGVRFLALRQNGVQIAPFASVSVARTSPTVLRWSAGSAFKYTASDELAFFSSPGVARTFTSPTGAANPWIASLPAEIEVQATERLIFYAVVDPWGSMGDVARGILLELYGGVGYTFVRSGEISFDAGTYNVLSTPAWNTNVPGSFAGLSLYFWRY